jgi:hypothetical protein
LGRHNPQKWLSFRSAPTLGTRDGQLYYLLPENNGVPVHIGSVEQWLATAAAAGY